MTKEADAIKTINFATEIKHGKTIIEARPTPIFYEQDDDDGSGGHGSIRQSTETILAMETELRDLEMRAETEGLLLSAKEQAEIDLLDKIHRGYERHLTAKVILDGEVDDLENLTVRNRSEAIKQAEAQAGIKYPYHFVWLDGASNTAGVIEFPWDGYSKVYAVSGSCDDKPEIVFLDEAKPGERTPKKPYFECVDGKTIVYMDSFSGAGTEQSPFEVATLADWEKVATGTDGWDNDSYYVQTADLDFDGETIKAIPSFYGHYDGQGCIVSNGTLTNMGLFASVSSPRIVSNLKAEQLVVKSAVFTKWNYGTLSNCCAVDCSLSGVSNDEQYSLLVVQNVGHCIDCYATGAIMISAGLPGPPPPENAGSAGLVSVNYYDVSNCYAVATIATPYEKSGLVHVNDWFDPEHGPAVSASFYDKTIYGETKGHGTPLTTIEMQSLDTYLDAGWDICEKADFDPDNPTTWWIDDGEDYPRLWYEWEGEPEIPEAGAETATTIGAEAGAGIKRAEAGAEAGMGVSAEGAGSKAAQSSKAEASTEITAQAGPGEKFAESSQAEAGIALDADAGPGVKTMDGSKAEAGVAVSTEGGAGVKVISAGTETAVTIDTEGRGIKHKTAGAEAQIAVKAEIGPGAKVAMASKAEAGIGITSTAGPGLKISFAGKEAAITIDPESGIVKVSYGGAETGIVVMATGAGGKTIAFSVVIRLPAVVYDTGPIRLHGAVYDPAPIRLEGVKLRGYEH